jgi:hypothetical protein
MKGVNKEAADKIRGGGTHLIIVDEAAQMDNLSYVIRSILLPMTMTTGGRILIATTPGISPGHESTGIYEELATEKATSHYTILDNPRVSIAVKAEFLKEAGEKKEDIYDILIGVKKPKTTTARREYFCEFVTDAENAVLPEWDDERSAALSVVWPTPQFFRSYVAMDPGMRDRTGVLFGYYDFIKAVVVIEDELVLSGPSTATIAKEVKAKESLLWTAREHEPRLAPLRVLDGELRLAMDLKELHGLSFQLAEKSESLNAINLVRTLIQSNQIVVNPRCVNLIRQMKNAIWNRQATDFDRASDKSMDGHYDLVAALKYFCRTVNRHDNPYPPGYDLRLTGDSFLSQKNNPFTNNGGAILMETAVTRRISKHRGNHGTVLPGQGGAAQRTANFSEMVSILTAKR